MPPIRNKLQKIWIRISPTYRNILETRKNSETLLQRMQDIKLHLNNCLHQQEIKLLQIDSSLKMIGDRQKQVESSLKIIRDKQLELNEKFVDNLEYISKYSGKINNNSQYILTCDLRLAVEKLVIDNIQNPEYFDMEQRIYNEYKKIENRKIPQIFVNRIPTFVIEDEIGKISRKFGKICLVLTDVILTSQKFSIIQIEEIHKFKDDNVIFVLAYNHDYDGVRAINELNKYNLKYHAIFQTTPMTRYFHTDKDAFETLLDESINEPRSHFCPVDFENIFQALRATSSLLGDYVEIGTFQGASARAALNFMRRSDIKRRTFFLDTFEGFTYAEANKSSDGHWAGTHTETSVAIVREYLRDYPEAELVKINICADDLPSEINQIAVCNIDVDIYDAVKAALLRVKDKIVTNGIIIAEDYGHTPLLIGAQKAVIEFLEENPDLFIPIYMGSGQIFLIKK